VNPLLKIAAFAGCCGIVVLAVLFRRPEQPDTDSGPVAHWVFDPKHVKGKEVRDLAGKLNAKLVGAPKFLTGEPVNAIHLSDAGQRIVIDPKCPGDAAILPKESITVTAWVRLEHRTRWGGILGVMQDNGDYERGFILGYDEKHFYFSVAGQKVGRMTYLAGKTNYELGRWYHVAGTYDGATMRVYVNGQEDAVSKAQSGPILYAPAAPFVLGRYQDDDEDFGMLGALKEVRLYKRALAAKEVAAQFDTDKALAIAPPQVALKFVVAPYLQYATRDGMTVMWETNLPGTSAVEFSQTTPLSQKVSEDRQATLHEIRLTGLKPQTQYVYRVTTTTADGRTLTSAPASFLTAVNDDSAFSFTVVGDTQNNPTMTGIIAKQMWERRPHFVMHCGDVVEVGPEKRRWVEELFRPCAELFAHVPVFPTIGNHERNHAHYYKYFSVPAPKYYYRYRYGNADFFAIDTNKKVGPGTEQYKWLDQELAKSDAKWKFVYHHHPAWSSDADDYGDAKKGQSRLGDLNVRNLVTLYEKHKVDIVFNGHIHLYERTWPIRGGKVDRQNGIIYITSGGGGGKLEDVGPVPTWFKAQVRVDFHYCYINIHGGRLEFRAFDHRGYLFDCFDLDRDRK
jgi:hypothetical protein